MALVDRLKNWRGLARLRRRARRTPSPATFGDLAERHIAVGETADALRVAEEGLRLFPDSDRLAQVRLFAKKGRLTGEIRKLREDIQRRPNPVTYTQLAEIYRELGSHDEALEIAAESAERFPLNEHPYLIQGEIRLERFLRDQIAKDSVIAEAALRKVVRLNQHNAKAHLLLAEVYYLVGMLPQCRKHLRTVLQITPTARAVQDFVREMDATPDAGAEEETFDDLAEKVEMNGMFANPPERFPAMRPRTASANGRARAHVSVESLREQILDLGGHAGVRNVVVLDREGEVLSDFTSADSLSRHQFAELVIALRNTADDTSRRMDTGALVRAEIEGPAGSVTVTRVRSFTLAVLYGEPLRHDRVSEMMQDFIARNLTASKEEVHA